MLNNWLRWSKPTLDIIKYTKTIAIANKESIIWLEFNYKNLKKFKTNFIPVDPEYFSFGTLKRF